jgi:hypothetical protein
MSMMKIEVVADPSVTTGGHAIIRLRGVALLPPGATFRIEPIDETLADEIGWPVGDIQPIETRQTSDGMGNAGWSQRCRRAHARTGNAGDDFRSRRPSQR